MMIELDDVDNYRGHIISLSSNETSNEKQCIYADAFDDLIQIVAKELLLCLYWERKVHVL